MVSAARRAAAGGAPAGSRGREAALAAWLGAAVAAVPGLPAAEAALPCDSDAVRALKQRARAPATQPEAAADLLEQAFRACPEQAGLLLEAARLLASSQEFDEAAATASRFLAGAPRSLPGLVVKANAELMAQRFEDADESARRALEIDPRSAGALKVRGNARYFLGDAAQAEQAFLKLLDSYPEDSSGAYMLGRIYYQEERFSLAAAQFQRVLRLEPASYKAYDNLGLCFEALGETERAVRHYLAAIQLVESAHPSYDWPYANLASLLIDRGDFQKGLDAASTAARRNPSGARNFFLAGKALAKLGRSRDSLRWLERATELDPAYAEPLYWLGRVRSRLGDEEGARRALSDFRAAKASEPDDIR